MFASLYPLANYFIYQESESTATMQDYLFVFKRKETFLQGTQVTYADEYARNILTAVVGFDAPGEWLVYAYKLSKNSSDGNPKGIMYTSDFGYVYSIPSYTDDFYDKYFSSCIDSNNNNLKASCEGVLPIVKIRNGVHDINMNIQKYTVSGTTKVLDYGALDQTCWPKDASLSRGIYSWTPGGSYTFVPDITINGAAELLQAPVGVVSHLIDETYRDASGQSTVTTAVYWGTLSGSFNGNTFTNGGYVLRPVSGADISFRVLRTTASEDIWAYTGESLINMETAKDSSEQEVKNTIVTGESQYKVAIDWNKYKFNVLMSHADDVMTILIIFVLNILPRVGMFLFLILLTLSMIADVKIWQIFCDKVFDVYKFLTFGRQNIHTINMLRLFLTSIVAIAVFFLFMDGTIIHGFSWFARAISAIVQR
jgi:hypothetical protein